MNTASRLESTGEKGRIHISEQTAGLLIAAGKENWVVPRVSRVQAKGKGALKTFWLVDGTDASVARSSKESIASNEISPSSKLRKESTLTNESKSERLINWNVDVLLRLLQQVVARRTSRGETMLNSAAWDSIGNQFSNDRVGNVLNEVKEIIALPVFDPVAFKNERDATKIELGPTIKAELRDYVSGIASMYRDNPFHNFEVSSICMCVKLQFVMCLT